MSEIRVRLDLACDGDDGHRTRLNVQSTNVLEGLGTEAGRSWIMGTSDWQTPKCEASC